MKTINIEDYYPLIHKICNKYPIEHRGDLFNELYIECYEMLDRYDASQGNFQTFAYKRLDGAAKDYLNKMGELVLSLDDTAYDEDGGATTNADLIVGDDDFESDFMLEDYIEVSEKGLTHIEKFIREKHREGESPEQIILKYYSTHGIKSATTIRTILNK